MNKFIDFLIEPFLKASPMNIFLEIIAVSLSILSVILAQRSHIGVYPVGIVGTGIYIYLTFIMSLYGEFIVNIYYIIMSCYGWYKWRAKDSSNKGLVISFSSRKDYFHTAILWGFSFLFIMCVYYFIGKIHYTYAWVDIFTTATFFSGMYQMSLKKIENWLFWIIGNIISIPFYFIKGLPFTSIQFIVLTCLAVRGYYMWKKILKPQS